MKLKMRGRVLILLLLGAILAITPLLAGCGDSDELSGKKEIVIGFYGDFTGPAASAVYDNYLGFTDYFTMVREENLMPDVKINIPTYDSKSDRARAAPGYLKLRDQGSVLLWMGPSDAEAVLDRIQEDKIPTFCGSPTPDLLGADYTFWLCLPIKQEVEILMTWINENWDYASEGLPKIGVMGNAVSFWQAMADAVEAVCVQNPDKYDWLGSQMAPYGTSSWTAYIKKLESSDFIITALVGSPLASFVKEARARGYENEFISSYVGYLAFWQLMKASLSDEDLDGAVSSMPEPWWNDPSPFISECEEYALKYHPDREIAYGSTGYITGWAQGMILTNAINRAVEKVGADNVTGAVLWDTLHEVDMTVEGWGNPWKITEDNNCFAKTARMMRYSAAEDKWVGISDWIMPDY
ncbi:ABC transporter substrate-binding protein [Chloroflexota bacterium]